MNQYSVLKQALKPHLGWHGARISFLALFLLALLKVKTVNLKELALGFEGLALVDSHYKKLQQFFAKFEIDYHQNIFLLDVSCNIITKECLKIYYRLYSSKISKSKRRLKMGDQKYFSGDMADAQLNYCYI